jgi:hypothetical protein
MSVLKARGKASRANLRRGNPGNKGGRPRNDDAVRRISRRLILNRAYQKDLRKRLEDGTLHPSIQALLWYYSFGKPREVIETQQITPVRIEHVYTDAELEKR